MDVSSPTTLNLNDHVNIFAKCSLKNELKTLQRDAFWYDVALKIAPLAFMAISITAIWFAAAQSVAMGMVAIAGAFMFIQQVYINYVDASLRENRDKALLDIEICKIALEEEELLNKGAEWQINSTLTSEGANLYLLETKDGTVRDTQEIVKYLTPLYCRYKAMVHTAEKANRIIQKLENKRNELQTEISAAEANRTLTLNEFRKKEVQIAELQSDIHYLSEGYNVYAGTYGIAESKISAAYYHYLLKNPTSKKTIVDFGSITRQNLFYRKTTNDNCYFFTKGGNRIDKEFFLNSSVNEIERRLFSDSTNG